MPFIELQSVDSTNNYARRLVNEGLAQSGTAIFAHEQWAGRGQREREWLSEKDSNIILSVLVRTDFLRPDQQFRISLLSAVTLLHFFNELAGGECRIKWPNDLYWQDRKAGGILIENIIRGSGSTARWEWSIIGIGVNINQVNFPPALKNPVSLRQITGRRGDPLALAKKLADRLLENAGIDDETVSSALLREYNEHLYRREMTALFRSGNRLFEATVKSVGNDGRLMLQTGSVTESFSTGELEWEPAG